MKLYLSSFRLGLHPYELVRLAGGRGAKTCAIFNATDSMQSGRDEHNKREMVDLRGIGLAPEELDLHAYAGDEDGLRRRLDGCQLIWVRGGNPFVLRRAMLACGFDDVVKPLIESGTIAYGGYSAGVCVITPTLHGIELVDDPHDPDGHETEVPWDCMGLVDYHVAPHYRSDHPESAAIEEVVTYFVHNNMPYRTLRDGEVMIIENGTELLRGFPDGERPSSRATDST